ncbi:MAG: hypothetical protein LJE95_03210 [Acidobacteria bacterium]|nr:hypothetical protein [Acidobacteriota bacterium]
MLASVLLALSAVVLAWFPPETVPWAGTVIALVALGLIPGGWARTSREGMTRAVAFCAPLGGWLILGLLTGWDRAQGCREAGLLVAVVGLVWLASRWRPEGRGLALFVAGVSLLTVWAAWQVGRGFEADLGSVGMLPEALRSAARQRFLVGRAFASQTQPGHLAVLLATVVPIAVSRLTRRGRRWPWALALLLCGVGIALSRSLLGAGLAVAGAVVVSRGARRREVWLAVGAMAAVLVLLVVLRSDLILHLEPVRLRIENWHSALWVWRSAPVVGVGLGGFGQAALAAPFAAGNHPQHAHALPMEWAAELGLPGIFLAGAFYLWLFRLARRLGPVDRGLAVAVLIVPLHSLLDFSIYMAGVALPWAVLLGWSVAVCKPDRVEAPCPSRLRPVAVTVGAAFLALLILNATGATLEHAAEAVPAPDAVLLAAKARRVAPWRLEIMHVLAGVIVKGGPAAPMAAEELASTSWWRPRSPATALALAVGDAGRGNVPGAAREAWAAARYAPPASELRRAASGLLGSMRAQR